MHHDKLTAQADQVVAVLEHCKPAAVVLDENYCEFPYMYAVAHSSCALNLRSDAVHAHVYAAARWMAYMPAVDTPNCSALQLWV